MDKFVVKVSDDAVFREVGSIEELANVLGLCPIGCVKFHLRGNLNDFAEWVGKAQKKDAVALKLRQIKLNEANPEETRKKIVEVLKQKPAAAARGRWG